MCDHFVAGIRVCYALTIAPIYSAEVSPVSSRSFITSFPEGRQWRAQVLPGSLPPQRTHLMVIFAFYIHKCSVNQSSSASLSSAASLIEFPATGPRSKPKGKKFTTKTGMSWKKKTSGKVHFRSQIWMRSLLTVPLLKQ
ncbi:hypothetical protein ACFX13_037710 [Malus domestica]